MTEYSIASGEPVGAVDPSAQSLIVVGTDQYDNLPLAVIVPSLTNPRKTFNADKLAELAASIKASGVHQPILVRPLPGNRIEETTQDLRSSNPRWVRATHEIVAGERRYRACVIAGVATIPALIRYLTDNQVLEIQIIENLQRDDLSELEEAEGYEQLMQHSGINADAVGAKIGKSRSYVYSRLKLLDLSFESKQALRVGNIDASRALLIARIPDAALQAKALAYASTPSGYLVESPSVRALQTWLQQNVMLRLESAPFDTSSTQLCKEAGSCKVCPKRTGANPDLFADVIGADICTDPPCYQTKEAAHRDQILAQAEAKGMRVIEGKEAKEVMPQSSYSDLLQGYTRLDQRRADIADEAPTMRKLLGDALGIEGGLQPVLIEHPRTRELIEAVPTAEAEAILITRGLIKTTKEAERGERHIEELKASIDKRMGREGRSAIYTALVSAVHAIPEVECQTLITTDLLRAWLTFRLGDLDDDDMSEALNLYPDDASDESSEDAYRMHIARVPSANLWRALAIIMGQEDRAYYSNSESKDMPMFDALASATGVDTQAVTKATRASIKAEVAEQIRDIKAQSQAPKTVTPTPRADDAFFKGEGGAKTKTKKPKTTAAEAHAAIAAAMQAQDQTQTPESETDSGAATASQGIYTVSGCALPVQSSTPADLDADLGAATAPQGIERATTASPEEQQSWEEQNYITAVALVRNGAMPTISNIQRVLVIGYNQAARLLERMEVDGIVTAMCPSGHRTHIKASTPAPEQAQLTVGFVIGQRVKVTSDSDKLGMVAARWAAKSGTITKREPGGGYWNVVFKGRNGGVAMFAEDQLEVVEVTTC